jgi:hypothetical protein
VGRAVGNALLAIAWIVTRTVGSLVAPAATTSAKMGFGDLVPTALEILIVAGCAGLLARRRRVRAGWWVEHAQNDRRPDRHPSLALSL